MNHRYRMDGDWVYIVQMCFPALEEMGQDQGMKIALEGWMERVLDAEGGRNCERMEGGELAVIVEERGELRC